MPSSTELDSWLQSHDVRVHYLADTRSWPTEVRSWTQHLVTPSSDPTPSMGQSNLEHGHFIDDDLETIKVQVLKAIQPLTDILRTSALTDDSTVATRSMYPVLLCQLMRITRLMEVGDTMLHNVNTALPRVSFPKNHPDLTTQPTVGKALLLSGWRRGEASRERVVSTPFMSHHDGVLSSVYTNHKLKSEPDLSPQSSPDDPDQDEDCSEGSGEDYSESSVPGTCPQDGDDSESSSYSSESGEAPSPLDSPEQEDLESSTSPKDPNQRNSGHDDSQSWFPSHAREYTAQQCYLSEPIGFPHILPTLIVASSDDLIPQLAGALYHRWVWNIRDPMFGVQINLNSNIAHIAFAWMEDDICVDGQLPTVHIAMAPHNATPDPTLGVFDLASDSSVIAFVQFFSVVRHRMIALRKEVDKADKSYIYQRLDWRASITRQLALETETFVTSLKTEVVDSWRNNILPTYRPSILNNGETDLSNLYLGPDCDSILDRWLFVRISHGILRLKSSGQTSLAFSEIEAEVNMMVNLYNEISQIYWPRHWISIDSLPRVDSILEPTRQLMWVKYEERKQHESILDAEDSLATSLSGSFDQLLHIPNDAQPRPDSVDGRVRSSLRALISPHQWFTLLHRLLETLHGNDNAPMVITGCEVNLVRNERLATLLSDGIGFNDSSLTKFHLKYPLVLLDASGLTIHLALRATNSQTTNEILAQARYHHSLSQRNLLLGKYPAHAALSLINEGRADPIRGICNAIACIRILDVFTPKIIDGFGSRDAFEEFLDSFTFVTRRNCDIKEFSIFQTQRTSDEARHRAQSSDLEESNLLLPILIVEIGGYPFGREGRASAPTQTKMFSTSAASFLAAIGIKDFPVFHLTIDGGIGVLGMTWYSSAEKGILYTERQLVIYDLSDPFSVYHFAGTLLQLRQRSDALAQAFEQVRTDFISKLAHPEGRKELEWSQKAQREHCWEAMNVAEKVIKETCTMRWAPDN